jgi:hypothetical protein
LLVRKNAHKTRGYSLRCSLIPPGRFVPVTPVYNNL